MTLILLCRTRREELLLLTCGADLSEFDRQMTNIRNYYRKTPHEACLSSMAPLD